MRCMKQPCIAQSRPRLLPWAKKNNKDLFQIYFIHISLTYQLTPLLTYPNTSFIYARSFYRGEAFVLKKRQCNIHPWVFWYLIWKNVSTAFIYKYIHIHTHNSENITHPSGFSISFLQNMIKERFKKEIANSAVWHNKVRNSCRLLCNLKAARVMSLLVEKWTTCKVGSKFIAATWSKQTLF